MPPRTAAGPGRIALPDGLTPGECEQGGGTVNWANNTCKGGTFDGQMVD
ncbi:hypothetical protein [Streptomyces fagopyri]|nr:hypothetical protein [Streptomyces fagopyri]